MHSRKTKLRMGVHHIVMNKIYDCCHAGVILEKKFFFTALEPATGSDPFNQLCEQNMTMTMTVSGQRRNTSASKSLCIQTL